MIWQQQTAADAHRQRIAVDATACGLSSFCCSAADGITTMAVDVAMETDFSTMETAAAVTH